MKSVSGKYWEKQKVNKNLVEKVKQDYGFGNILSQLIISRNYDDSEIHGINNYQKITNIFKDDCDFEEASIVLLNSIKNNENVLVTAHTGSGKTVPAIFGIADSLAKNKKIVYTSPIKSLSNQKFYELKQKFPDVGILTGDIKFNPDAQCLIMTTEILRNILYQKTSQHVNLEEIDKINFSDKGELTIVISEKNYAS